MTSDNRPSKRLKVCHVVSALEVGGMENGVVNLCNGHDRSQVEPMICCLKRLGPMAERLNPDVKVVCLGFSEGKELLRPWRVARFLARERPDIVHTHGWGGGSWDGVLGARLAGCPVVINGEHGLIFAGWHQVVLQRLVARLCSAVFSVSAALQRKVVRVLRIPPSRITVISNGVDVERFSPRAGLARRPLDTASVKGGCHCTLVCCIGSLKMEKNQLLVVRAAAELLRSVPGCDLKLLLVGDGPDRPLLENYVEREGLKRHVFFMGRREDIAAILAGVDVLVSASKADHEGMSNVILEAMASALPVVATRSVGTEELVVDGATGFLVNEGDLAAFTQRLKLLVTDKSKARALGAAARMLVLEKYSLKRMIREYEQEYRRLYARKKPELYR